jgi:hypothetical protein
LSRNDVERGKQANDMKKLVKYKVNLNVVYSEAQKKELLVMLQPIHVSGKSCTQEIEQQ